MSTKHHLAVKYQSKIRLSHPAFSSAEEIEANTYLLKFPIQNRDLLKSKKAQLKYCNDKVDHLKSFGIVGSIIDLIP